MTRFQRPIRARGLLIGSVTLALLASLLPVAGVSAAVGLVPATGGTSIATDGSYSTLTGPSLTESVAGELGMGSIVIGVQQGTADYLFNPNVGVAAVGGGGCAGMTVGATTVSATGVGVLILTPSTSPCTLSWSGIQVKANHGLPLPAENLMANGSANMPGGNYGNLSAGPGAPVIAFTAEPSATQTIATNLVPDPSIRDQDALGNPRAGDLVTLSVTPGSGPGALTCTSPLTQTTGPSGQLTWTGCKIDQSGNYRLRAATTTGSPGDSSTFVVNGVATHLAQMSYPAAITPPTLTPQLSFGVYDASNNLVTTDTRSVALSINLNPGTFSCPGGLATLAVGGVATFPGCTQTVLASGYSVTASATGLTQAVGPLFAVSPAPSKLQLCWGTAVVCNTTPPSPNAATTAFATQPTVRVQDAGGNTIATDNSTVVSLAIAAGTPTSGGPGVLSCSGGNSVTVVGGIGTFASCAISAAGVGYMLTASSTPALTPSTSLAFSVTGTGPPAKLKFVVQPPASVAAGTAFPTNLAVGIADSGGALVTSGIAATINLALGANPGGSTLICTGGLAATTVSGVATFTGCSLNAAGSGYTIVATASSTIPTTTLLPVASTAFTVTAVTTPAVITVAASAPTITWASTVVISVHFGANGANRTFRLEGARDPNSQANFALIANLMTNAAGDATFAYHPPTNLFYRAVFAGAPDLGAATSPLTRVVVRQIAVLRPTSNGAVRTVSKGTAVLFTTTVRPSRPELTPAVVAYTVFQLQNGAWMLVLTRNVTATAAGLAQLSVTFSSSGSFYVRSQANPTPYNANSVNSPLQRYDVN